MKKLLSVILTVCMLLSMVPSVVAEESAVVSDFSKGIRVDFPVSEENGANAKMFMLLNGEDYNKGADFSYPEDYYLGLDYLGYLKYDDTTKCSYPTGTSADVLDSHYGTVYTGALVYTIDGTDNNNDTNNTVNLTTKNKKLYWNINDVDYLINPNEKAIKLYTNVETDKIDDTELAARFNSLNQVTFNVTDGNYTEIGFLAACGSKDRKLTVTLVYDDQDGSKTETKQMSGTDSNAKGQSKGAVSFQDMNTHNHGSRKRTFAPYTVPVDSSRVLKEVKLKSNSQLDEIIIISAWGEGKSIEEMLTIMNPDVTEENYLAQKALLEKIDAELTAKDIDLAVADAELYEKFNTLKNNVENFKTFEITSIEKADSAVTVTYKNVTGANITGTLIVAQYSDATEKELVKVQTLNVTLKNNETSWQSDIETEEETTVKFFIWKDLLNFFPYY